jgi:cardiolipin synthase A/B
MNQSELVSTRLSEPHVPFLKFGSYPARHGNVVRPLVDGLPALRRICEAVETARHSVWVTVAFATATFQMPDRHGSFFDLLDRAVERGLDVRVLFWRPNPETSYYGQTFSGSPADRDLLRDRASRFSARWDRAHGAFCQHQKSWLMDAGRPGETAFVGGINLTPGNLGSPGHMGDRQRHDAYVEVTGPSATDVHHNFVQRWNEASQRAEEDGVWGHNCQADLSFPARASALQGESLVQIQRNVPAGLYTDGRPTPGGQTYEIAGGERSIFEQYRQAIDAARSSIYIENQALPVPEITIRLEEALARGVDVVVLAPAEPEEHVRTARRNPACKDFFDRIAALGRYDNFALVGIAGQNPQGGRSNIYVHAKLMLVDDAWATIGSCNLHSNSLFGHTEMNAAFWDPKVVRALRCQLLTEHLGQDTARLDDRAALRLYRSVAVANRLREASGESGWQGLAFSLDPATYGT